jgi:hypothetical protein
MYAYWFKRRETAPEHYVVALVPLIILTVWDELHFIVSSLCNS